MKKTMALFVSMLSLFLLAYAGSSMGVEPVGATPVNSATVPSSVEKKGVKVLQPKGSKAKTRSKAKAKVAKIKPVEKSKAATPALPPVPVATPAIQPAAAPAVAPAVAPTVAPSPAPIPVTVAAADVGVLSHVTGEVKLSLAQEQEAKTATQGAILKNGMQVATGKGSTAVLKFDDGETIALGEGSSFKIENYSYAPKEIQKSSMFFSILTGSMRAITGLVAKNNPSNFKLRTPTTTIGIRGTDFLFSIVDGNSYIQVTSGAINVTTSSGAIVSLSAGETIVVSAAGAVTATGSAAAAAASSAGAFTSVNTISATLGAAGATGTVSAATASGAAIGGVSTATITAIGAGVVAVGAAIGGSSTSPSAGGGTGTTGTTGTTNGNF